MMYMGDVRATRVCAVVVRGQLGAILEAVQVLCAYACTNVCTHPHTWGRGVDSHTQFLIGINPRVCSQSLVFAAPLFPVLLKTDRFHYGMSMKQYIEKSLKLHKLRFADKIKCSVFMKNKSISSKKYAHLFIRIVSLLVWKRQNNTDFLCMEEVRDAGREAACRVYAGRS